MMSSFRKWDCESLFSTFESYGKSRDSLDEKPWKLQSGKSRYNKTLKT